MGGRVRLGHTLVLDELTLEVAAGECVALLGSSGSGKTTILRLLAGFVTPERGSVWMDGREITSLPPERREMAMIHQRFLLFPHQTVAENVAFGLPYRGVPRGEQRRRALDLLTLVGLDGLAARYPHQLSGGQQQRVALARALATSPRTLLLDEPLNSLDSTIRERLLDELQALHRASGMSMIYVTHDQAEAARMAARVAVLADGRILQVDAYEALRARPATATVARVLGLRNLLAVRRDGDRLAVPDLALDLPAAGLAALGRRLDGPLLAYLPPDHLVIGPARDDWIALDGVVAEIVPLAYATLVRLRRGASVLEAVVTRAALADADLAIGESATLSFAPRSVHLLPDG